MKVKTIGNWEFLLTPESLHEAHLLRDTYAAGHVHFVCKAFMPYKKGQRASLLLTPSMVRWQRPPEPKKRVRRLDGGNQRKGEG